MVEVGVTDADTSVKGALTVCVAVVPQLSVTVTVYVVVVVGIAETVAVLLVIRPVPVQR